MYAYTPQADFNFVLPWVTVQKWEALQVFIGEIHCFCEITVAIKFSDYIKTWGTGKIVIRPNANETQTIRVLMAQCSNKG